MNILVCFLALPNPRMIIIFLNLHKKMFSFHSLKISNIDRITSKAVVVSFEIPDSLKAKFNFLAGQYISLQSEINGEKVRRSYSVCSAPQSGKLQVGIKEVTKGVFSSYANQQLSVGDSIEVGIPEGRFTLTPELNESTLIGIAAGSGITPIMAMIKSVLSDEADSRFILMYGNKTPKETMFYEELIVLEKENPKRLKIHWVFSQANLKETHFGRIDTSLVNYLLKQIENKDPKAFYLCGPESMINIASDQLIEKGIAKDQIFFELFTSAKERLGVAAAADKGVLTLTYDEITHSLELIPEKTILEIALQAKLDVPYSCQGGVCSSCIARVTSGKAGMKSNQILTDAEIEDGLILTCQAIAQTQEINIDFDDV
tara:strand:- start:7617 stop:8735 length:1119 start_codon:yes stop_codon:yes gene_type:complete